MNSLAKAAENQVRGLLSIWSGNRKPPPYVSTHFLKPMYALFKKTSDDEEQSALSSALYALELGRYPPEVLVAAARHFAKTRGADGAREKAFMPTLAECLKVCEDIYSRLPSVIDERAAAARIEAMRAYFTCRREPRFWDAHKHGPFPGREGCLIPIEDQEREWRDLLTKAIRPESQDSYDRWEDVWTDLRLNTTDEASCTIPRRILMEFRLPCSEADLEAIAPPGHRPSDFRAQEAERKAHRLAEIEREEREKKDYERRRLTGVIFKSDQQWRYALEWRYKRNAFAWNGPLNGPAPAQPGSLVPPHVQREFGFTPDQSTIDYWRAREARPDLTVADLPDPLPPMDCREILKVLQRSEA